MGTDRDASTLERLTAVETKLKIICTSYVSKESFRPVQLLAYGLAAAILSAAVGALLAKAGIHGL
jgi:uncharacterized OsmC-like protein